jgi:hypothetical protein
MVQSSVTRTRFIRHQSQINGAIWRTNPAAFCSLFQHFAYEAEPVHEEKAPRDFDNPNPLPIFAIFSRPRVGETSTRRKINHVISHGSRRGLFDSRLRKSASIGRSDRFARLGVGDQDTTGFPTPETLVRKKKIPE